MKPLDKVKQIADKHGFTTTKFQYAIIREIMNEKGVDVTEEECREICNLQRHCRAILTKDSIALDLEKEWRSPQVAIYNQEVKKASEVWEGEAVQKSFFNNIGL